MTTIEKNIIITRIERKFITCNQCKAISTVDIEVVGYEPCSYAPVGFDYYRLDGDVKTEVKDSNVKQCPRCQSKNIIRKELKKAKHSAKHVCDAKCQAATSESCVCSCEGKNHGIKHKVEGSFFF